MFQEAVARHAIEKAAKGAAGCVVLVWVTHQGHKNVLHNFLSGPGVSAHPQRKAIERRLMAPVEGRKRLLVAFPSAPEQHVISFLVRDAHLPYKTFYPALNVHSQGARDKFPRNGPNRDRMPANCQPLFCQELSGTVAIFRV